MESLHSSSNNISPMFKSFSSIKLPFKRPNMALKTLLKQSLLISLATTLPFTAAQPLYQDNTYSTPMMPAESAPHLRTLMVYPSPDSLGNDKKAVAAARKEILTIALAAAKFEPVHLYSQKAFIAEARQKLAEAGPTAHDITVKEARADNLWARDTGPVFVTAEDGTQKAVDFHFNFWGEKDDAMGDSDYDRRVTQQILKTEGVPRISAPVVAEGGGIEVDGLGTFLGTESCLVNDNRNPGKTREQVEDGLRETLGIKKFIWLEGAKELDVTDFHVDALARLVGDGRVVVSRPNRYADDQNLTRVYEQAVGVLAQEMDALGRPLEIVEIEEADPEAVPKGPVDGWDSITLSYVNYYEVNGGVLVPRFGDDDADAAAMEVFGRLFPDRQIEQVFINILPNTGGGIHCATQQWPAVEE